MESVHNPGKWKKKEKENLYTKYPRNTATRTLTRFPNPGLRTVPASNKYLSEGATLREEETPDKTKRT